VFTAAAPGAQTVRLRFDGTAIFQACAAGPYTVGSALLIDHAAGVTPADQAAVLHTTAAYSCGQFAAEGVFLPVIVRFLRGTNE
jgi:hypothetical protein